MSNLILPDNENDDYIQIDNPYFFQNKDFKLTESEAKRFTNLVDEYFNGCKPSTQQQYKDVYNAWYIWCGDNGLKHYHLDPLVILHYLNRPVAVNENGDDRGFNTRKNHLIVLRQLLIRLHESAPQNEIIERWYAGLHRLQHDKMKGKKAVRKRVALSPDNIHKIFDAWNDDTDKGMRNQFALACLFYCGMRLSEVVNSEVQHFKLDERRVEIHDSKYQEYAEAQILGSGYYYIKQWIERLESEDRHYCFPPISSSRTKKKGHLGNEDKPLLPEALWVVIEETRQKTGIYFASHSGRYSLATNLWSNDAKDTTIQRVLRHDNLITTYRYILTELEEAQEDAEDKLNY